MAMRAGCQEGSALVLFFEVFFYFSDGERDDEYEGEVFEDEEGVDFEGSIGDGDEFVCASSDIEYADDGGEG